MDSFSIHQQLTLKEYRKIYYRLLYSKIGMILFSVFSILFIICTCIFWLTNNNTILNSSYYTYAIAVAFVAIWIPLVTLYTVYRSFKSNYVLHEPITYDFSDDGYIATGKSFNSNIDWARIYKVKIFKGWLILYHNRNMAAMIKTGPADAENVESLKKFLKNGHFKAKLKW